MRRHFYDRAEGQGASHSASIAYGRMVFASYVCRRRLTHAIACEAWPKSDAPPAPCRHRRCRRRAGQRSQKHDGVVFAVDRDRIDEALAVNYVGLGELAKARASADRVTFAARTAQAKAR